MQKLFLTALFCACVACGQSSENAAPTVAKQVSPENPINVVATTGMIADMVKNIGQDYVHVVQLMGPGVDPHLYKASQGDIAKLSSAQIIFYNGLNLEGKMNDIFVKMAHERAVLAVADAVDQAELREPPEFAGHFDPHIWFDVQLWSQTIPAVVQGLSALAPGSKELFEKNAQIYQAELLQTHLWVKEQIASIPASRRILVTAHDAFGYFGRAYGIEVMGLQGVSTVSEFGLQDIQRLVSLLVERKVPAVFVESSIPKRSIEAVVEGAKSRGLPVKIGGQLYSDAMGEPGSGAESYVGMVKANVKTIVDALH